MQSEKEKINLQNNIINVYLYNHDNNQPGLAQKAISQCKNIIEDKQLKKI